MLTLSIRAASGWKIRNCIRRRRKCPPMVVGSVRIGIPRLCEGINAFRDTFRTQSQTGNICLLGSHDIPGSGQFRRTAAKKNPYYCDKTPTRYSTVGFAKFAWKSNPNRSERQQSSALVGIARSDSQALTRVTGTLMCSASWRWPSPVSSRLTWM